MEGNQSVSVQSVDRALYLLDILKEQPNGAGVTELANKIDVSKSTIHRLLTSLWKGGYVAQGKESERYVLGLKCLELGEAAAENLDVRQAAKPYLQELAEKTEETVHLVTLEYNEIVYIEKIESQATIRMFSRVGKRAPVYCTGAGKAILAFLPEEKRRILYAETSFYPFTSATITEPSELELQAENIRKKGFALDEQEHEEGIQCTASPVFDRYGNVIAGISVAGPAFRVTNERLTWFSKEVKRTAESVSREMGAYILD